MSSSAELSPQHVAAYLAGKAIAAAQAFLDGRSDAEAMAKAVDQLYGELLAVGDSVGCNALLDPTRLLAVTMMRTARVADLQQQRWRCVMVALADLVRSEARALREDNANGPRWSRPNTESDIMRGARAC